MRSHPYTLGSSEMAEMENAGRPLTQAQTDALRWLSAHGASGIFDKTGVLTASGERAPVMRLTWNALRDNGHVTIERKRVTLTEAGKHAAAIMPRTTVVEDYRCGRVAPLPGAE